MRRRFFVLLVVLALSSLLLSGIADSAVRTMDPDGTGEVPDGVVLKDGDGTEGGDDDRWGDLSPGVPVEENPEVGEGTPGGDPDGSTLRMFTDGGLWSWQAQFFFSLWLI